MRKTVCAVVSAAVLLSSVSAGAIKNADGVVTADVLNVREEAGIRSHKIGELTKDTDVKIISSKGNWYKIEYGDKEAYVSAKYVSDDLEAIEASKSAALGEEIVEYAKEFIGIPYVYGGTSPAGFDCSGFVKYVYAQFGIYLPRVTYDQINVGENVNVSELKAGDLVFFREGDHVGIYVGDGKYIHAPRTGRTISVDELKRDVYAAKRII